jgi:hypothetical protein
MLPQPSGRTRRSFRTVRFPVSDSLAQSAYVEVLRQMQNLGLRKVFLYTLILSVAISAVVGIGVLVVGNFGDVETKILLTTLTITVTSILGLACGVYFETGRGRIMPVAGIICSMASAAMWVIVIWSWRSTNGTFVKILMSATLFAVSCSLLSLLSLARLDRRFIWTRYAAHAAIWALAAILLYLIWLTPADFSDLLARTIGVLGIIIASVTVMTPVLHKLSSHGPDVKAIDDEIEGLTARIAELEIKKREIAGQTGETSGN